MALDPPTLENKTGGRGQFVRLGRERRVIPERQRSALFGIKLVHTVIWAFFAGCIVAIPMAAAWGNFRWALVLSGLVTIECAILALNGGRCPLTDLAAGYTEERADNFD